MSYKKSFIVICTAFILVCAIPVSASARGSFDYGDSDMLTYTYNGADMSAVESPGYHIVTSNYEIISKMHTTSGAYYSFVLWVPFQGYFFVVVQNNTYPTDCQVTEYGPHNAFYMIIKSNVNLGGKFGTYYNGYSSFDGLYGLNDGSSISGLHVIFGHYVSILKIPSISNETDLVYTTSRYNLPDQNLSKAITDEVDRIYNDVYNVPNAGAKVIPGIGDAASEELTLPDGSPAPTNEHGNPAPTNQFGQPVETLNNGMPYPTYPNGEKASTYVDPSGNIQTVPYTIVDNGAVQNDVNNQFDKLNSMISDLDSASSLMESNQDELSAHVDNTRDLVDGIMSWFPAPLIAVLVCGVIMIIAVKITGSGASV